MATLTWPEWLYSWIAFNSLPIFNLSAFVKNIPDTLRKNNFYIAHNEIHICIFIHIAVLVLVASLGDHTKSSDLRSKKRVCLCFWVTEQFINQEDMTGLSGHEIFLHLAFLSHDMYAVNMLAISFRNPSLVPFLPQTPTLLFYQINQTELKGNLK